jgi:glutamate-1-semialdehyde 2,1-aminomutase
MPENQRNRGRVLAGAAEKLIVGGRLNQLVWPEGRRPVIARGSGSHIWDVDGREFVDYMLGSGPLILGHAHPRVVEAVRRQAGAGSTFYALSEPTIELAERIVASVPCADMVQFCTTGGEATFYALRLARAATGRDAVLKFEGGYHGGHDYALMSLTPTEEPAYPRPQPSSHGIPAALLDDVLVAPFNDIAAATDIIEQHGHRLAAIIVEPVQRVLAPEPGFLEALRALADRFGIVLVFDEIVTGFRLAPGGAQERFGVVPDLAALGKILGGGYALAAVCGRRDIMQIVDHERRGRHRYAFVSGTLNGNPIAAAAGNATLDVLSQPGAYDRLDAAGERLRSGLARACAAAGVEAHVLGLGPLFQVVATRDRPVDYRGVQRGDAALMRRVSAVSVDAGLFMSGDKGYVSLAHTDDELDRAAEIFADALEMVLAPAASRTVGRANGGRR